MYCTNEEFITRNDRGAIVQLLNDENRVVDDVYLEDPNGDVAGARLNDYLSSAQGEVEAYLRKRYSLPLSPVPEIIRDCTSDVALYNMYKRRHAEQMPETVVKVYEQRIKQLKDISGGVIEIDAELRTTGDGTTPFVKTNKTTDDRVFNGSMLDGFRNS